MTVSIMLRKIAQKVLPSQSFMQTTQRFQSLNRIHHLRSSSTAATFAKVATPASTPTIADVLVEMTFVDPKGARRKVKGMVGKSFVYL
jgi:hypothetical protein